MQYRMTVQMRVVLLACLSCAAAVSLPGPPVFAATPHYPAVCYLPPDSALCEDSNALPAPHPDLLTRYYFDSATEQCYPFGVQQCGGNENRFSSRSECEQFCRLN